MYLLITEGKAQIYAPTAKTVSRDMPVFYNPVMKRNRDIAILILNSLGRRGMSIADTIVGAAMNYGTQELSKLPAWSEGEGL